MLRAFACAERLRAGAGIWELHTIAGWPQVYTGRITHYALEAAWAMSSRPTGWSPFPMPHAVSYVFEELTPTRTVVTVTCGFVAGGVLAFGPLTRLTRLAMRLVLAFLLTRIADGGDRCASKTAL